jgi:hypothetical protein
MGLLCLRVIWEDSSSLRNGRSLLCHDSVQFGNIMWTLNVCDTNVLNLMDQKRHVDAGTQDTLIDPISASWPDDSCLLKKAGCRG